MESIQTRKQKLHEHLKKANVPTLPVAAQKLVKMCSDDEADFSDFAKIIAADPGLAARILRVANTAYYGLRNKVTTLERAIGTLGLKYVKTISLGFQLATTFNHCQNDDFDMKEFWRQNILRGVLAKQIANRYCPARREEAFLVGLLQDCGIPFMIEAFGEKYLHIWRDCRYSQASLFKLERELFDFDHLEAVRVIAAQCSLPDILAEPIWQHHLRSQSKPSLDEKVQLCQISYFVGTLSLNSPETISDEDISLSDYCRSAFDIDAKQIKELLAETREEFNNISLIFKDILPEEINPGDLIGHAKNLLSDMGDSSHRELLDLKHELEILRTRCDQLTQDVDFYKQKADTDSLTGLFKREHLEEYLNEAVLDLQNKNTSLTVFYLGFEDFKQINTQFGLSTGDHILRQVTEQLQRIFVANCCLARYCGAEFVVAMTGLQPRQAIKLGKGLLKKVSNASLPKETHSNQNTIDIVAHLGVLYCEPGSKPGPAARILELAGNEMCQARQSGETGLHLHVIPTSSNSKS